MRTDYLHIIEVIEPFLARRRPPERVREELNLGIARKGCSSAESGSGTTHKPAVGNLRAWVKLIDEDELGCFWG